MLYAPTWRGPYADSRVYSLPMGERIVRGLLDRGVRVVFRAHPFNYRFPESAAAIQRIGRMLDNDRRATGREHLWGACSGDGADGRGLLQPLRRDDRRRLRGRLGLPAVGKPFSIVSVGSHRGEPVDEVPAARAAYVLRDDLGDLAETITNLLVEDPLADIRRETKAYYLGDFSSDGYADGFLNAARDVIDSSVKRQDSGVGASARAEQGVQLG